MIILYWAVTRPGVAPDWERRAFLCDATGFDFGTPAGCKEARSFATERLGTEIVEALDHAAFKAASTENTGLLEHDLWRLWEIWCSHKKPVEADEDTASSTARSVRPRRKRRAAKGYRGQ